MKFIVLNTDYTEYLSWLYANHPGLERRTYDEQLQVRNDSLFGIADFFSRHLKSQGHEAWDIHANNAWLQRAWAREHSLPLDEAGLGLPPFGALAHRVRRLTAAPAFKLLKPVFRPWQRSRSAPEWALNILAEQIKRYRPDVVINCDLEFFSADFLASFKPALRLLVGQHAARPLSSTMDFSPYDFITSSFPPTIEALRRRGCRAVLHRLGFESSVLERLPAAENSPCFDAVFIGSFTEVHSSRMALLEEVSKAVPSLKIWGPRIDRLSGHSRLRRAYQGQAWGRGMYDVIRRSRIVLNHHGDVPSCANNMRLFETTGMGSFLLTDWKPDLHELFEPGREVAAYRNADECVERIRYYLAHDQERSAIASAGQARTLLNHTYSQRVQELLELVRGHA